MPRELRIDFKLDDVHRVRNFGEALFRKARDEQSIVCSLDEIDRATNVIFATIRSASRARRSIRAIEDLLAEHGLRDVATIAVLDTPP